MTTVAPVQDLIVDVMAAADPVAQRMATARLERLAPGADQNFAAAVNQKIEAAGLRQGEAAATDGDMTDGSAPIDGTGHAPVIKALNSNGAVYRKFEAFILQML